MPKQTSCDLVHELATKTIVLQAASRKLEPSTSDEGKPYFQLLQHAIEDSINLLRRLQLEINDV